MKKVKNLEVNLKKLVALGASILTIGTMAGCAKTEIKEEITQSPSVTQPQEEPEVVVVDPNAPLFDITDEEVFNQKVDELFEKANGLSTSYADIDLSITSREEAAFLFAMLNIDDLSKEQTSYIANFNNVIDCDDIDFLQVSIMAITEFNIANPDKFINLSDYIASKENRERTIRMEEIVKTYTQTHQFSDSDIEFMCDVIDKMGKDTETESINSAMYLVAYDMYCAIDKNYYMTYGEYSEQLNAPYEIFSSYDAKSFKKEFRDDVSTSINR